MDRKEHGGVRQVELIKRVKFSKHWKGVSKRHNTTLSAVIERTNNDATCFSFSFLLNYLSSVKDRTFIF